MVLQNLSCLLHLIFLVEKIHFFVCFFSYFSIEFCSHEEHGICLNVFFLLELLHND